MGASHWERSNCLVPGELLTFKKDLVSSNEAESVF